LNAELHALILKLLDGNRLMSIATNRSDGWPQNTIVGYANDGLTLYCFVARTSQKYANIKRDPRVSIAIANDVVDPNTIQGLSMAARASPVEDRTEFERAGAIFLKRYPEYATWPAPDPAFAPMLRVTPEIISVLDYAKGFGHSDLVTIARSDLPAKVESTRRGWFRRS
jgi:nitroimidazol reductase NimA-like FMN-containing flavoprotein (pyridoxamine 5'-phosphate oxidase superfamily)